MRTITMIDHHSLEVWAREAERYQQLADRRRASPRERLSFLEVLGGLVAVLLVAITFALVIANVT